MIIPRLLALASISLLLVACTSQDPRPLPNPTPAPSKGPLPATGLALASIAMFGDDGWGATYLSSGPVGNLLRTGDGGHSWRTVTPPIAQGHFLFGFAFVDSSHAWLMEGGPRQDAGMVDLLATLDGGRTWSTTTAPGIAFRGAIITFADSNSGWLATPGEPGSQYADQAVVIDRTKDGGTSWQMVSQAALPPDISTAGAPSVKCGKTDLSFLNASAGWLTGGCNAGITFDFTTDGGITWTARTLASPEGAAFSSDCAGGACTLSAPRFPTPQFGYMVLHTTGRTPGRSWLYTSADSGRSWILHALPGQETTVAMANASNGYASIGPSALTTAWLYRTGDGGRSWQPVPTNRTLYYAALDCVSPSRCWALTPSPNGPNTPSGIFETTDGGSTWVTP